MPSAHLFERRTNRLLHHLVDQIGRAMEAGTGEYAPIPPVFGPMSPSNARL